MQEIDVMVDGLTSLPADQFNQPMRELENAIQASGQTLTSSDLLQLSKSLSRFAADGDFYTDSGSANAYILTESEANRDEIPTLEVGQRIRFVPANNSTSASTTIKVGNFSAIAVSFKDVPNGGTPTSPIGAFKTGTVVEAVYRKTPDTLTAYWQLQSLPTLDSSVGSGIFVSEFSQTGASWIATVTDVAYVSSDDVTLTGLPLTASVISATLKYTQATFDYSVPATISVKDDTVNLIINSFEVLRESTPPSSFTVLVHWIE